MVNADRQPGYMQQWNLNLQRILPAKLMLELGYSGSNGIRMVGEQDLNQARLNLPGQNLPLRHAAALPRLRHHRRLFQRRTIEL